MSAVEIFKKWFEDLSKDQKREVAKHVIEKHSIPLNEGMYGGPAGMIKGIFGGPAGQESKKCPYCGK